MLSTIHYTVIWLTSLATFSTRCWLALEKKIYTSITIFPVVFPVEACGGYKLLKLHLHPSQKQANMSHICNNE
jgi:hypothetical protein